jgi:hypothetical protein
MVLVLLMRIFIVLSPSGSMKPMALMLAIVA